MIATSPVLANVSAAGCKPFPALVWRDRALALEHGSLHGAYPLCGSDAMSTLLRNWGSNEGALKALSKDQSTLAAITECGMDVGMLLIAAPVSPEQVYCTIGNYKDQLIEAALDAGDGPTGPNALMRRATAEAAILARRRTGEPYVCLKGRASVTGAYDFLRIPPHFQSLDWEVEIGVVIGKSAWQVSAAEAMHHIAGYCVVNDITLRDRVFREDPKTMGTDWLQSKSHPGWLPVGPWLVPSWDIPDPQSLKPWLRLNGDLMQSGTASDMVFGIGEQISYLSRYTRLQPGDLLCTGSPAGFGTHHKRYMRPGDVVEAGVDPLGTQRVHCTA